MGKEVCIPALLLLFLTSCNPVPISSSTPPPLSSSETSSSPNTQTIRDTKHLHLIFSDKVPTEDQIAIADFYEGVVQTVTSRFHYVLTQTITGYVGGLDYAFGENNMFYQPYSPADRFMSHELLHPLLSDVLGPSPVTLFRCRINADADSRVYFFNEWAIMAFDLYFIQPPRPIHLYAAPWVRQGVTLEQILRHGETLWPSQVIHPIVSFLLYLLETYPWEDFQRLWGYHEDLKQGDWENTKAAIRTAYGKDLEEIEAGWRAMLSQIDLKPEWLATIQYTNDYLHTILAIKGELNLFGKGLTYEQAMEQWRQQTPDATKLGFGQYYLSQPLSNLQKYEQSLASMKRYFSDLIPTLAPKLALPAPKLIEIKTHLPWWGYVLLGVGVALAFSLIFCIFLVRKKSKTHSQEKGSDRIGDSHRFF